MTWFTSLKTFWKDLTMASHHHPQTTQPPWAGVVQYDAPDPIWAKIFDDAHQALQNCHIEPVRAPQWSPEEKRLATFFESYFTNYVEGSCLPLQQAKGFLLDNNWSTPHAQENAIAQDLQNTFTLIDTKNNSPWPTWDLEPFSHQLHDWHRRLLCHRPNKNPGQYKHVPVLAGNTIFARPQQVQATLRHGLQLAADVPPGLAQTIMAHHVTVGVHPFIDGNGRISRLIMNAYLDHHGYARILHTTIKHRPYIEALIAHTKDGNIQPSINYLQQQQTWSTTVDYSSWDTAHKAMDETGAYHYPW